MVFIDPVKRVTYEKASDFIAVRAIEIDRFAPWCFVSVCEIWGVLAEIVALRTEMVVYNIENDRQPLFVGLVDERF